MINYHFDDTIHIHENSHIFFLKLVTRVEDFIVLIHTFFFFFVTPANTHIYYLILTSQILEYCIKKQKQKNKIEHVPPLQSKMFI